MRIRVRTALRTALLTAGAAGLLALPPAGALADEPEPGSGQRTELRDQLAAIKAHTADYHDLAAAEADGYAPASDCVPGMGYHYLAEVAAGQDELEITEPNVLVYAPRPDGGLRLVAVEYASATPATLFGEEFAPPSEDVPFHTLHVWVWERNPDGLFDPTNPRVSCD
jgi:hypothetical protein